MELGVRADVPAPLHLVHTHLTANVELPMVASSAIPPAPFTQELAVPSMDGAVIPLLTVGLAARADVMAQRVVLGVPLERPLQL